MLEAITTGTTAIWFVSLVMLVLLFIAAANDSVVAAIWFTVIGVLVLQFVTAADPFAAIIAHPYTALGCFAAYIPIGICWSLFRWWKMLQKSANNIRERKADWQTRSTRETWEEYVADRMPSPAGHKEEIICWICYWPFSVAAYLLIDFLREVAEWIYARISGIYQSMADRVKASLK